MGHTMGSCGAIETIIAMYLMEEGFIAPTLNLDEVDERCAMINHVAHTQGTSDPDCHHPEFCLRRREHQPHHKKDVHDN